MIVGIGLLVAVALALSFRHMQTKPDPQGTFAIFEGKQDGHRLVLTLDTSLSHFGDKSEFPYFLAVHTELANPRGIDNEGRGRRTERMGGSSRRALESGNENSVCWPSYLEWQARTPVLRQKRPSRQGNAYKIIFRQVGPIVQLLM